MRLFIIAKPDMIHCSSCQDDNLAPPFYPNLEDQEQAKRTMLQNLNDSRGTGRVLVEISQGIDKFIGDERNFVVILKHRKDIDAYFSGEFQSHLNREWRLVKPADLSRYMQALLPFECFDLAKYFKLAPSKKMAARNGALADNTAKQIHGNVVVADPLPYSPAEPPATQTMQHAAQQPQSKLGETQPLLNKADEERGSRWCCFPC